MNEKNNTEDVLVGSIESLYPLAAAKLLRVSKHAVSEGQIPVFTVAGEYQPCAWTEWTEGFLYGALLLAGEGAGVEEAVIRGRDLIHERMGHHLTNTGIHDHGFQAVSTYGNLLRLAQAGVLPEAGTEAAVCTLALKVSGAVQVSRWTPTDDGLGFVHSFNGAQSLFIDTMRTLRAPELSWLLGHQLCGEGDVHISLLGRAVNHALVSSRRLVFHGDTAHRYDVAGRTSHEGLFNPANGEFRCRSTQQGYSPFSTWSRGIAWAVLGFAEQLELLERISADDFLKETGLELAAVRTELMASAVQTADHYLDHVSASDGVPYWDDGAPGLVELGDWRSRPADPFDTPEPVDSSAAAIVGQGLLRLGQLLRGEGSRYTDAGLALLTTLLGPMYLASDPAHDGLLLHSTYHWPNGWDHVPVGARATYGESSLWGDYHLLELAHAARSLKTTGKIPSVFDLVG